MPKTVLFVLALMVAVPNTQGQVGARSDVAARTAQYRRLVMQFNSLNQELLKDQRDAVTPEQKAAVQIAMAQLVREYATKFMAIASQAPQDATGLEALGWVASRAAAGSEFDAALELLGEHHPGVTGLEVVCRRLFYHPTDKGSEFLERVINKNPQPGIRAVARTALAIHVRRQYEEGAQGAMAGRAEELLERALREFDSVPSPQGTRMLNSDLVIARSELEHLRGPLAIGKIAPDIKGQDLDGIEFKLSDYRGKIVVFLFWNEWCNPCYEQGQTLLYDYADKPITIVGVNSDQDREAVRDFVRRKNISWRSFWNGENGINGPITKAWRIRRSPTVYVLDRQGRIRYKFLWGLPKSLDQRLDTLLAESG